MTLATTIAVAIAAAIVGALVAYVFSKQRDGGPSGSVEERAKRLLGDAQSEAETARRQAELEAKELLLEARTKAEQETQKRLTELQEERTRLLKREESIDGSEEQLRRKEQRLSDKEAELGRREQAAEATARASRDLVTKAEARLNDLAQMSTEQARELLLEQIRDEARIAGAKEIKKIEEETNQEARSRATTIIATAIQRYASDYVAERTVSVVQLPGDEMKGRIIGREGRNIRVLEAATGVDLIIDDTPEAVILSSFNPVRREVARLALTRLISDGRIHPTRIEEVVKRCAEEVQASCKEAGEQAVFDLGLHKVHPELIRLLGELKYRASYAQNLLQHSVEVAFLAGTMATELGIGVKQARRAGLLHDIGKAVAHEIEGSHAAVGANIAKKYGENPKVVHAIAAHHGQVEPCTVLAHVVDVANRLSAQRPGARRDRLETYVQRLSDLEELCKAHEGVARAHAIQAGREVRVIVENDKVSDEMALMMSKDIAKEVEEALTYPAQIRVSVIRESRATSVAR